jgi:predicted nuclease of restriction endonuclease-like (RecB) superfamily
MYIGTSASCSQNAGSKKGYGASVVSRLSVDLKAEFPDMGLSPRNLWDMKRFYERYKETPEKLRRSVAVLPWKHNLLILSKSLNQEETSFYAQRSIENGWTRDQLLLHLKAGTYQNEKCLNPSHNFKQALSPTIAGQAVELLKNKYNLGFLGLTETVKEIEFERKLIEKIRHFILELGKGFTFIGNQHRLEFNGKEYFIDILLYHRTLRCLIAIELKMGAFKPEYVGKMNFYLGLLDRMERQPDENHSMGIILYADKDHTDVEIALQDIQKPIGIAEYQLFLPMKELQAMVVREMKNRNVGQ